MINDFHLYPEADDTGAVDPEVALLTAYLARELSDVQVLAIEERLVTDAAFRATMQPLLDAWSAPVAVLGAPRLAPATLTDAELESDWRRFVEEHQPSARQLESSGVISAGKTGRVPAVSRPASRWPARTTKAAAVVALVALPVLGIAQIIARMSKSDQGGTGGSQSSPAVVPLTSALSNGADPAAEARRSIAMTPEMLAAGRGAEQQPTLRALSATVDLRLPAKANPVGGVSVSDGGMIAVLTDAANQIIQVFSSGGMPMAIIGSSTPNDLWLARGTGQQNGMGWIGDSLWVLQGRPAGPYADVIRPNVYSPAGSATSRREEDFAVLQIEPTARLVRLTHIPVEVPGPAGTTSRPFTVSPATRVVAAYPGGGLLVGQEFPADQFDRALGASAQNYLQPYLYVRIDSSGRYRGAWPSSALRSTHGHCFDSSFPLHPSITFAAVRARLRAANARRPLPFCAPGESLPSPDGRWMTYASGTTNDSASVQLSVATLNIAGDTLFSRRFRVPGLPVDAQRADSGRRAIIDMYGLSGYGMKPEDHIVIDSIWREKRRQNVQPVQGVLTGNDGTVFIRLASRAVDQQWLVISAQGDAVGIASIPLDVDVRQVSRSHVWGVSRTTNEVVRLRIGS